MILNIKEIEFLRKNLQISQNDFAEKIGITRFTYKKLLDNQDFRLSQLIAISKILEISFFKLFEKSANNYDFFTKSELTEKGIEVFNKLNISERENEHLKEKITLLEEIITILKLK